MNKKIFLLAPVLLLSSCGIDVPDLALKTVDGSPYWKDNYYHHWNDEFKNLEVEEYQLDEEKDQVFLSYGSENFKKCEPNFVDQKYLTSEEESGYGPTCKLSKTISEFKEGYLSKLFDGIMFCNGRYEKVRVQVDEEGFSRRVYGRALTGSYFAVQFKSVLDFKTNKDITSHMDNITMKIGFYFKDISTREYVKRVYNYTIENCITNAPESVDAYTLFGFSFKNISLKNCEGFSIEYKVNNESYNEEHGTDYDHALLLYEVLLPYSTWSLN